MTKERAKELLPIIQAFAEGKKICFVMENVNKETVYILCGKNVRFDRGRYVLSIPEKTEGTSCKYKKQRDKLIKELKLEHEQIVRHGLHHAPCCDVCLLIAKIEGEK